MSRASFSATFRAGVRASPMDYLTDWCIGVAKMMLKAARSIKAIAPAVGYSNVAAFARVFRRRVGMSPADVGGALTLKASVVALSESHQNATIPSCIKGQREPWIRQLRDTQTGL